MLCTVVTRILRVFGPSDPPPSYEFDNTFHIFLYVLYATPPLGVSLQVMISEIVSIY